MSERFDVIVIGAGSGGAAVAARASENPRLRVLLLESGPDYPLLHETPFDLVNSFDNSYVDHDWRLQYQPTAPGREQAFPRGRVTGGSSAVNTTIALRGVPEDYDAWAAAGNDGWSFQDVLPAFRRLERDLDFPDAEYHGDSGPISIRRYPEDELTRPQAAFLEAARELGYPDCPDANAPDSEGSGPHPMNKLGRVRISTAVGYLAPARIRENLEIRGESSVRRVLVSGRRVTGVEVETPTGVGRIEAGLVVVCAGAIHTPGVLVRSGIGGKRELESLGIDAVAALEGVGENLCDHPALAVVCKPVDAAVAARDQPIIQTILRYTCEGSQERNDLQIEALTFAGRSGCFGIAAVLEQCESRGSLRQTSADAGSLPRIEPALCSEAADARRLAICYRDTLRFVKTRAYGDLIESVVFPDPARESDLETLEGLCRKLAGSGFHPCGTAKMGPASDPLAVVDSCGRVHGIEGLAVADASIMPSVPRANTNLTSIMIGERIGEWLRTDPGRYGL